MAWLGLYCVSLGFADDLYLFYVTLDVQFLFNAKSVARTRKRLRTSKGDY